jgi:hypothetical protein
MARVRKKASWVLRVSTIWCWIVTAAVAATPKDTHQTDALKSAAPAALRKMLPSLDSAWMKQRHGFDGDDDLKNVSVGEPFQPHILTEDAVKKYREGDAVLKALEPYAKWYLPVISKGKTACWLSLYQNSAGNWQADSLGMADWAHVWAEVCREWPATKGYSPTFVIMPSRQRFYFTIPEATPANLTPLSRPTAGTKPGSYKTLQPANETFAELRRQENPGPK